jgi:hypothetical protein
LMIRLHGHVPSYLEINEVQPSSFLAALESGKWRVSTDKWVTRTLLDENSLQTWIHI